MVHKREFLTVIFLYILLQFVFSYDECQEVECLEKGTCKILILISFSIVWNTANEQILNFDSSLDKRIHRLQHRSLQRLFPVCLWTAIEKLSGRTTKSRGLGNEIPIDFSLQFAQHNEFVEGQALKATGRGRPPNRSFGKNVLERLLQEYVSSKTWNFTHLT